MEFRLELPTTIPAAQRAALRRDLSPYAQLNELSEQKGLVEAFMVVTATVQALGVIYNWIQIVREANPRSQVTIKKPDGTEIIINNVTLEELKRFLDF